MWVLGVGVVCVYVGGDRGMEQEAAGVEASENDKGLFLFSILF